MLAVQVIYVYDYDFIPFTHTCLIRLHSHGFFSAFCSFDKIIRKEIPSQVVYEDEKVKYYLCYQDKVPIVSNVMDVTL